MSMMSLRNDAALKILQGVSRGSSPALIGRSGTGSPIGPNLNVAMSDVTKRAMAKIAEIVSNNNIGGTPPSQQASPTDVAGYTKPGPQTAAPQTGGQSANPFARQFAGTTASGQHNANIQRGDGNDVIEAWGDATVSSGSGNDAISVQQRGTVDSGDGDDTVYTYSNAKVTAGAGNDRIATDHYSTVDAGSGDDIVYGNVGMTIVAGAGNDEVRANDNANVDAGEGDDWVVVQGNSKVRGGSGNDTLIESEITSDPNPIIGHTTLEGGEGDDYIQVSIDSTAIGGKGNDTIRLTNKGGTVIYNKGDGQDVIRSHEDLTLQISGYSKDDVIITKDGGISTVSFKGSDETIQLNLVTGAVAHLTFEGGATLDVDGIREGKSLEVIATNPAQDWSSTSKHYVKKQALSNEW